MMQAIFPNLHGKGHKEHLASPGMLELAIWWDVFDLRSATASHQEHWFLSRVSWLFDCLQNLLQLAEKAFAREMSAFEKEAVKY